MLNWLINWISKPQRRTPMQQSQVDDETSRLALYYFPLCPYCIKVNRIVRHLNLSIERRDAANDTTWRDDLRRNGGKLQTPCLRIQHQDHDEWLYESEDIIRYLRRSFAASKAASDE
ncbi:MAG: glutathione S-transferase N-terminal domain-containing protein [Candidatus Thiodiazotropha sp.]